MSARAALLVACLLTAAPAAATVPAAQLRSYQDASTLALTTTGRSSGQPRTVTIWFAVDAQGRLRPVGQRQPDSTGIAT
ncbi:MAG: hypothetical protein U0802_04290 [Candidatus Binatia bacterium]